MFTILVTEKGGSQQRLDFDEAVASIGRVQGNQVMLPRGNVSKRHAKLELKEGAFFLTDQGSTNGTYVNGRRIAEPTRVFKGDKVYIGEFILSFEGHDGLEKEAAASATPARPVAAPAPAPKPRAAAGPPRAARPTSPRPAREDAPTELPDLEDIDGFDDEGDTEMHRSTVSSIPPDMEDMIQPAAPRASAPRPRASAPAPRRIELPDADSGVAIELMLDELARQIKRIDRGNLPSQVDSGTAGKARIVLRDLIADLVSRGKFPPDVEPGELFARTFRAAVDLGPLTSWLDDPEVEEVRIVRHDATYLRRGGDWVEAPTGFGDAEALSVALRCLEAGLQGREEEGLPGLARFRLEDGPLVLAALSPVSSPDPSAVIHKDLPPRLDVAGAAVRTMAEGARSALEEAIGARARIAIVGPSVPVRLSVLTDLVRLVPAGDLLVAVEDHPLLGIAGPRRIGLTAHGLRTDAARAPLVGRLLSRAVDMEPDWIAVSGAGWVDLPEIIACSAGRRGVIVDLPVGARGPVDASLASAMAVAGVDIDTIRAASLLKSAFDVVVAAARTRVGKPAVRQIAATGLGVSGEWAPKVVYDASGKG
jgi:pilus assembly protein CpaF